MIKHEAHCTMNPNRVCGFCKTAGNKTTSMDEMLVVLQKQLYWQYTHLVNQDDEEIITIPQLEETAIKELRDISDNCPACILSALRQGKAIVASYGVFNYESEVESFWKDMNKNRQNN